MRYRILIFALLLSQLTLANGNRVSHDEKVGWFLRADLESTENLKVAHESEELVDLLIKLKERQLTVKSHSKFLSQVFYVVHKKMLGQYEQYVSFGELFSKDKKYDCVTGTALYALVLDELGYAYDIHETDYHVYLIVKSEDKQYLFEATDPINGFAWNPVEIEERQAFVNKESRRINLEMALNGVASSNVTEQEKTDYINNVVSLKQLAGLHYYNQALKKFNEEEYHEAYQLIMKAHAIYPSDRIKNMGILTFSIAFGD